MTSKPDKHLNLHNLPSQNKLSRGGRLIRWENGKPVPVYAPPMEKQQVSDLLTAALSLEYKGDLDPDTGEVTDFDTRFVGMTNIEVIAIRLAERAARGNDKATTEILDRILGKPKQSHESVGVKMSYQDFLNWCEDKPEVQDRTDFEGGATIDTSLYDDDASLEADLDELFGE